MMEKETMYDLMYFGYEHKPDAIKHEKEFIEEVTVAFPDVHLKDAFDSIKGYRQEVVLPREKQDDFRAWLLASGWYNMSLLMQTLMLDNVKEIKRLIEIVKEKYPEAIKKDLDD